MSHFNVAVFTRKPDELERLLEPFNEVVKEAEAQDLYISIVGMHI